MPDGFPFNALYIKYITIEIITNLKHNVITIFKGVFVLSIYPDKKIEDNIR